MTEPGEPMQEAVAAALLASAAIVALVAATTAGPAVFAPGQPFEDVFPRLVLDPPQVFRVAGQGSTLSEIYVTLRSWAAGPDATLVSGRLAGLMPAVLAPVLEVGVGPPFAVAGQILKTWQYQGARHVGDPDQRIAQVVSTFRFLTQPA